MGELNVEVTAHIIALLYIFMPQIRAEVAAWVRNWNAHHIRRQRRRPHVHNGRPWKMFRFPEYPYAVDCRVPVPMDRLQLLQQAVDLDDVDLNEYLPAEVMELCDNIMERYRGEDIPRRYDFPYFQEFAFLRESLMNHDATGVEPYLRLCEKPVGGLHEFAARMAERGVDLHEVFSRPREEPLYEDDSDASNVVVDEDSEASDDAGEE